MTPSDREFYENQWPHFADPRWRLFNDHRSFGSVWWDIPFQDRIFEDQKWGGRIGFHVGNNWSKFFLSLQVGYYPEISFNKDLTASTSVATTDEVLAEATSIIEQVLPGLAEQAKKAHDEWWEEEQARQEELKLKRHQP